MKLWEFVSSYTNQTLIRRWEIWQSQCWGQAKNPHFEAESKRASEDLEQDLAFDHGVDERCQFSFCCQDPVLIIQLRIIGLKSIY